MEEWHQKLHNNTSPRRCRHLPGAHCLHRVEPGHCGLLGHPPGGPAYPDRQLPLVRSPPTLQLQQPLQGHFGNGGENEGLRLLAG